MAVTLLLCSACELKFKPNEEAEAAVLSVQRYDRLESRYLTTGDFSALQQMNTDYPIETRTLIEKMLQLGTITDANISNRFLMFYQDSTLQALIADAEVEYANMDDINQQLKESFVTCTSFLPSVIKRLFSLTKATWRESGDHVATCWFSPSDNLSKDLLAMS